MTTLTVEEKEAAREAKLEKKREAERKRRERIKQEKDAAKSNGGGGAAAPAAKAPAERRRAVKDPEAVALAERAKEIAPEIKSPYQAFEVRSLVTMLDGQDPIEYAAIPEEARAGGDPRDLMLRWARGQLDSKDPAAVALRARAREIAADERGKNLWGRKIAALLLAIAETRS